MSALVERAADNLLASCQMLMLCLLLLCCMPCPIWAGCELCLHAAQPHNDAFVTAACACAQAPARA
jgi:hypothetical protein